MKAATIRQRASAMLRRLKADQERFYVMFPRTRQPDFGGEGDDVSEMMRNLASAIAFVRGIIAMSDSAIDRHHTAGTNDGPSTIEKSDG